MAKDCGLWPGVLLAMALCAAPARAEDRRWEPGVIDRPFRVGHENRLAVRLPDGVDLAAVTLESSDPAIVEIGEPALIEGEVRADIRFLAEGQASIVALDGDGVALDELPVAARPARGLEVSITSFVHGGDDRIEPGEQMLVSALVSGEGGVELAAPGDVSWLVPATDEVVRVVAVEDIADLNAVGIEAVAPAASRSSRASAT